LTPKKVSTPAVGLLDPLEVPVRVADELDRLDAAEDLDPAARARAVARLCTVALAVHKHAGPFQVGEYEAQVLRAMLAELALPARATAENLRR
jgi:hypothetical protein